MAVLPSQAAFDMMRMLVRIDGAYGAACAELAAVSLLELAYESPNEPQGQNLFQATLEALAKLCRASFQVPAAMARCGVFSILASCCARWRPHSASALPDDRCCAAFALVASSAAVSVASALSTPPPSPSATRLPRGLRGSRAEPPYGDAAAVRRPDLQDVRCVRATLAELAASDRPGSLARSAATAALVRSASGRPRPSPRDATAAA